MSIDLAATLAESAAPQCADRSPTGRRRPWRWLIAALVLLAWWGSQRFPCGPAGGQSLSSEGSASASAPKSSDRIRLVTFNIHGGKGADDSRSLERTAACLQGADLVGLNEVHGGFLWERLDQAEQLGRRLHQAWLFAPTEERWGHYLFGNGLLTSLPVQNWQRIPLSRREGRSFRNLIRLAVDVQGRSWNVLITHLDSSNDSERLEQLEIVSGLFLALAPPAVLMGDFNTRRDESAMQKLLSTEGVADALAGLAEGDSAGRIDWILTRGIRSTNRGTIDIGASDHPCYWVECAAEQ